MKQYPLILLFCCLFGCVSLPYKKGIEKRDIQKEHNIYATETMRSLKYIDAPAKKIVVAVYEFPDLTGAFKPNDNFATYSKAVSQGADAVVIDALRTAGQGNWFTVVERKNINALNFERGIVAEAMKDDYERNKLAIKAMQSLLKQKPQKSKVSSVRIQSEKGINARAENQFANLQNSGGKNLVRLKQNKKTGKTQAFFPKRLSHLRPAQYILQGGIISYNSDIVSGGAGLRFLNVGAFGEMRKDIVTVHMRLVDVNTGAIFLSTTLTKGIYSQKLQGSGINYVSIDRILEVEAGISYNEPVFEALNLTIQAGILDLIQQGEQKGLWNVKKKTPIIPPLPKQLKQSV